MMKTTLDAYF